MFGLSNWTTHTHHCKYVTHGQLTIKRDILKEQTYKRFQDI